MEDSSKLKFLPRHLQRGQPASPYKSKRRVTVEEESSGKETDRRKPSVFERLGPGATQRQSGDKGQGKRDSNQDSDDVRNKLKGSSKDPSKMKSQVVIRMQGAESMEESGEEDSDNWSIDKLAKKRQEILSALQAEEDKKSSSDSESSPERPVKKKKDKSQKKKKKHNKKNVAEVETKEKESKRKHESDEEDVTPKKKKKKKHKNNEEIFQHPPPVEESKGNKKSNAGGEIYDPESPTSVNRDSSPDSDSPKSKTKVKNKKKKKDKGHQGDTASIASSGSGVKSKKLLSPLKKVLKLQKKMADTASVTSKHSRSVSHSRGSRQRSLSSGRSSSSSSSRSPTPVKRKKQAAPPPSSKDRSVRTRKSRSKSMEKRSSAVQKQQQRGKRTKQQQHRRRSASSSSRSSSRSSSSSSSSSDSREGRGRNRRKQEDKSKSRRQISAGKRRDSRSVDRKGREDSSENRNRSRDDKGMDSAKRRTGDNDRGTGSRGGVSRRDQEETKDGRHRRMVTATSSSFATQNKRKERERDVSNQRGDSSKESSISSRREGKDDRRDGRDERDRFDQKGSGNDYSRRGGGDRDNRERERERERDDGKKDGRDSSRDYRGGRGGDRGNERGGGERGREEVGRGERGREEVGRGGERGRDEVGRGERGREEVGRGERGREEVVRGRDREREEQGQRDRDRERRGDSSHQRDQRGGGWMEGERDDRNRRSGGGYGQQEGEQGRRFGGEGRAGQFNEDSDRNNYDRGPGRFNRGSDNGEGRGWDDRRSGGGGGGRDDWRQDGSGGGGGRDSRYDNFRQGPGGNEFGRGGGRDDRRGPGGLSGRGGGMSRDGPDRPPLLRRGAEGGNGRDEFGSGGRGGSGFGGRDNSRDWKSSRDASEEIPGRGRDGGGSDAGSAGGRGGEYLDSDNSRTKLGGSSNNIPAPVRTKGDGNSNSRMADSSNQANTRQQLNRDDKIASSPTTKEDSLASLFSQDHQQSGGTGGGSGSASASLMTAPTVTRAKRPTKSFGGKKSPKKSGEDGKSDKSKGSIASLLVARSRGVLEKKSSTSSLLSRRQTGTQLGNKKDDEKDEDKKSRDREKEESDHDKSSSNAQSESKRTASKSPVPKQMSSSSRSPAPATKRSSKSVSPSPSAGGVKKDGAVKKEGATTPVKEENQKSSTDGAAVTRDRSASASEAESGHDSPVKKERSSDAESLSGAVGGDGGDIAAAMLGEGLDDDSHPEERVFSDWSDDDDADDILNLGDARKSHVRGGVAEDLDNLESENEENEMDWEDRDDEYHHHHRGGNNGSPGFFDEFEMNAREGGVGSLFGGNDFGYPPMDVRDEEGPFNWKEEMLPEQQQPRRPPLLEKPNLEKNLPNVKIVEDIQKEKPIKERRRRDTDNEGYEAISSDENDLDEDGEKISKRTIVGVLDLDIASLLPSIKPKSTQTGPVFMRYKAANVFAELGISRILAGDALFKKVENFCKTQMEKMDQTDKDATETGDNDNLKESTNTPIDSSSAIPSSTAEETINSADIKQELTSTSDITSKMEISSNNSSTNKTTTPINITDIKLENDETSEQNDKPSSLLTENENENVDERTRNSSNNVKKENSESMEVVSSNVTDNETIKNDSATIVADSKTLTASSSSSSFSPNKSNIRDGKSQFILHSESPSVHQLIRSRQKERSSLFNTSKLLTRALTARRDLDMRRRLCHIPHRYDQSAVYPSGLMDPDLYNQCVQLFKQSRPLGLTKPKLTTSCS